MDLGCSLYEARKNSCLSQEIVAEKLGVCRQTISKWEQNETMPDIWQAKVLAELYHMSLDDLIKFDTNLKEIEQIIINTNEEKEAKINWTKAWSKKYPVLNTYLDEVKIDEYILKIKEMLTSLQREYKFNEMDAMLVLKDILYHVWKDKK